MPPAEAGRRNAAHSVPLAQGRLRFHAAPVRPGTLGTRLADVLSVEPDWTCPFCSLLCDGFALERGAEALVLQGSDCPRARAGLAAHARREVPVAWIDGTVAPAEEAVDEAARRLARWRQPLLGGLATDMAGARALFRLAARTGAIYDHGDGEALVHGVRAVQDRGQCYTTLAEIRARADVIVCVGTQAVAHYPEFFRRCGLQRPETPCRRLVFLGVDAPARVPASVAVQRIAGSGELLADLQQLAALVSGARCREPDAELAGLAETLRQARYAVLVWEAATLPAHGALVVEGLNRMAAGLNRTTRAATFSLGGSDGAYAVQQVFTWLSGLPLRTRAGGDGLEHDPVRFAGQRLLEDEAVDGLLWAWSFAPDRLPPPTRLPRIVLGPPGMGPRLRQGEGAQHCVFIPVATPGIHAAGHLFRTDGVVVPLVPARDDGLAGVADVAARLLERLETVA
jgi:formylmethanofuran dehydrogenase subunit B